MDFNLPYDRNRYVRFFSSQFLPEDFEQSSESIPLTFSPQYTQQVTKIGESRSLDLNVYEVEHTSENDPRVSLSKESFRLLAEYGQKRALVLFVSKPSENYRLSLVTIDLKWEEGKRPTREYSNPRRFSFFLGPDAKVHTPQEYLIKPGRVADFDDLKNRFSIEVVNKDFYTQIAILFTKLTGGERKIGSRSLDVKKGSLVFPSPDDTKRKEFAVRLIGRLVFCWFLKKKRSKQSIPLLPEDLLSSSAIEKTTGLGGYYHSVLEPLFFEVLNTPMDRRAKSFVSNPWSTIPFLNGGLFTPHEDDYYELSDTDASKYLNTLKVPDNWLRGLLEIFEIYNFTIDENTPVDVELSIEPEMLGRIFENLLAEINPETGETARKMTGSYYTPRPIVEYIVDESLKQYLCTRTALAEEKISSLLDYAQEQPELSESEKDSVITALHQIKAIDPACGSGAFPMGVLQKVLLILQKLDPDSRRWLEKLLSSIPDPLYRNELKRRISEPNYLHKLGIIRDCIFGVDIQPIAVEISKLRCFLSLIVDEAVEDTRTNRGIEPLPNLEFKFVCANTLVGLEATRLPTQKAVKLREQLKTVRTKYLTSYGAQKEAAEQEFREIQRQMGKVSLDWGEGSMETLKLADWKPFEGESCSWFDSEWMFGIEGGFDVVIANPPYVFTRKMDFSDDFKEYVQKNYFSRLKSASQSRARQSGKINLFSLFVMKGLSLASAHKTLGYIVPNNILRTTTYDIVRKCILDHSKVLQIADLGGGVFDKVTAATVIILLEREDNKAMRDSNRMTALCRIEDLAGGDFETHTVQQKLFYKNVSYLFNIFADETILRILQKISSNRQPLGHFCKDIIEGIVAHKNLISQHSSSKTFPLLEGRNIKRYFVGTPRKYIIWDKRRIHRPRPDYLWESDQKIVIQRVSGGSSPIVAALDDRRLRSFASLNNLVLKKDFKSLYKYILALLNSKVMNFYYANSFSNKSELTVNISKTFLENLPIPEVSDIERKRIDSAVDKIRAITKDSDYLSDPRKQAEVRVYENAIDQILYKLYDLTEEQVAIIEDDGC
jgi:hypothetical protein